MKLLIATNNQGKARELAALLGNSTWECTTPAEEGITLDPEETGKTFEENAVIKARGFARASGLITLADDSGLEVEALNGAPGIHSARYAGPDATDAQRNDYLLARLSGVPREKRQARFRCVIAIAFPDERLVLCKGECTGLIAFEPRGENGFGYDPIFYLPELGKTMAELTPEEKSRVSHRGRAIRKAREFLQSLSEGSRP